jgi:hypothetical protein
VPPSRLTSRRYAPFTYDLWKHPETLAIVSKIAGIDLVTEMDLEIGHVNLSVKSKEIDAIKERAQFEADEGISGCPWEDDAPIVGWHRDSYPFVCVTMLSDCTDMVGGETALRTGTGEIMKVRGPQQVWLRNSSRGSFEKLKLLTLSCFHRAAQWSYRAATSSTKPCGRWAPPSASPW